MHVVGVSTLAAGHLTLVPELIAALRQERADDIHVICGGVIPAADHDALRDAGCGRHLRAGDAGARGCRPRADVDRSPRRTLRGGGG